MLASGNHSANGGGEGKDAELIQPHVLYVNSVSLLIGTTIAKIVSIPSGVCVCVVSTLMMALLVHQRCSK